MLLAQRDRRTGQARHQRRARLNIGKTDRLAGGVDEPTRDADAPAGDTGARRLEARRIGRAARQQFELVRDAVGLGAVGHPVDDGLRDDQAGVMHLDGRARAQLDRHAAVLGQVAGIGHVKGDRNLRVNAEGGCACPAQTDLFLHGKDEIDLIFGLFVQALDGLDHHHAADPVVHGLSGGVAVLEQHIAPERDRRADADRFAQRVDVKIVDGAVGLARFVRPDDAKITVLKAHPRPRQNPLNQAADVRDARHAAGRLDERDHRADFVHVGCEQHPRPAAADPTNQVADAVHADFVHVGRDFRLNQLADVMLVAGRPPSLAQGLDQVFHD